MGFSLYGQETLSLIVEDKAGQPLPSAVVHFVGKHFVSDTKGRVNIPNLAKGKYPIKVNYLGFLDYEQSLPFLLLILIKWSCRRKSISLQELPLLDM